jgi:hypothetical protein
MMKYLYIDGEKHMANGFPVAVYLFQSGPLNNMYEPFAQVDESKIPSAWFSQRNEDGSTAVYERADMLRTVPTATPPFLANVWRYVYREDSTELWSQHENNRAAGFPLMGPYNLRDEAS